MKKLLRSTFATLVLAGFLALTPLRCMRVEDMAVTADIVVATVATLCGAVART